MAKSTGKTDIQAELSALKEGFIKKIPAKVEGIRQSWEKLKFTPNDDTAFKLLHRQTHTLSGTGATYGFGAIAACAKRIEGTLQALPEDRCGYLPVTDIESLLDKLEATALQNSTEKTPTAEVIKNQPPPLTEIKSRENLVYLVGNNVDFLSSMKPQIQAFGYKVEAFSELAQFDEAVKHQNPAVVIMNVIFRNNPTAGIDHITRLNTVREHPLPTIFITGNCDILTRLSAVRANGFAYFTKPVLTEQLVDALDRFTHQSEEDPFHIVIVDDSNELSRFIALILQQAGMRTTEVNRPMELLDALSDYPADLILMDLYMPDCNGLELSQIIRQMDAYVSIPIVFLSSEHDLGTKMGAMSLGGDDFLTKPIESWHLVSAVSSRALRGRMIRKLAETDGLTGLLNHSKSKERLEIELSRAKRENTPLSFAMLDIDHFKYINDNYGHPAGDRVLKSLANMLKQRLRKYDVIGRYGGEEFTVILPNTDIQTAKRIMDTVRVNFGEINHIVESISFSCHFSCGIASFPDFDNGTSLNNEADKALYEAKESGRNKVVSVVR